MKFSRLCLCVGFLLCLFTAKCIRAQENQPPATPSAQTSNAQAAYPETAAGLEKLAKDIMKAQKDGDTARATALAQSMVLPHISEWYERVFGEYTAHAEGASYEQQASGIPSSLLAFFLRGLQEHRTQVIAKRFDKTCDDNAGENTISVLESRFEPVPLYDLKLLDGDNFYRLWALAYVDGGFRFIRVPENGGFASSRKPAPAATDSANATGEKPAAPPLSRIKQGGNVTASRLVSKVSPQYPEVARKERLQGVVRLRAIIGKDGSVSQLRILKGYCSLSMAALEAVHQWKYSPTLLMGQPVEVETTIDVIFTLNRP